MHFAPHDGVEWNGISHQISTLLPHHQNTGSHTAILEALGSLELTAKELARKLGRKHNSYFYTLLKDLTEGGFIIREHGYYRGATLRAPKPPAPVVQGCSGKCERDVLRLLREVGFRLTTSTLLGAMYGRGLKWSEPKVSATLGEMVGTGVITHRQDVRPAGYGLPGWD